MSLFENGHGFGGGVEDGGTAMPSSWASKVRAGMGGSGGSGLLANHMAPAAAVGSGHTMHPASSAAVGGSGFLNGPSLPPLGGLDNGRASDLLLPVAGIGLGSVGHYSPLALGLPVGGIGMGGLQGPVSVSLGGGSGTAGVSMAPSPSPLLLAAAMPHIEDLPPPSPANGALGPPYAAHSVGGLLNGSTVAVAPSPQGSSASRGSQRHHEAKEVLLGAFPCVMMRGLAHTTTAKDVLDFFVGLGPVLDVLFDMTLDVGGGGGNGGGASGGSAVVLFGNLMDYHGALQRYSLQIKGRYVNVMSASRREYYDAVIREADNGAGAGRRAFATPPLSSSSHLNGIGGGGHGGLMRGPAAGEHQGGLHSLFGAPATPTTPALQGDNHHPFPLPPPALPPPQQGQQPSSPAHYLLSQQQHQQQHQQHQQAQQPGPAGVRRGLAMGHDLGLVVGSPVLAALQQTTMSTPPLRPMHHMASKSPPPQDSPSLSPPVASSAVLTGSAVDSADGSAVGSPMHAAPGRDDDVAAAAAAEAAGGVAAGADRRAAFGGGSAVGTCDASLALSGAAAETAAATPAIDSAAAVAAAGAAAVGAGAVQGKGDPRGGGSSTTAAAAIGAKAATAAPTTATATAAVVAAAALGAVYPQPPASPPPPPPPPQPKPLQSKPSDGKGSVIRMRGLPYRASKAEVAGFFKGCTLAAEGVAFVTRADGRVTGEAYVKFLTRDDARQAMRRDREMMGNRYIELFSSSPEEMARYCKASGSNPI